MRERDFHFQSPFLLNILFIFRKNRNLSLFRTDKKIEKYLKYPSSTRGKIYLGVLNSFEKIKRKDNKDDTKRK